MSRRKLRIPVVRELIESILKTEQRLPQDVKMKSAYFSFKDDIWYVHIEHDSFDEVPEGNVIPIWEPPTSNATVEWSSTGGIVVASWTDHVNEMLYDDIQPKPEPPPKKKWREFL